MSHNEVVKKNTIGQFEFIALHGSPLPPVEQIVVLSRPGVDGNSAWRTGKRGMPFQLTSVVDAEDVDAAYSELLKYKKLIGKDPVELNKDSVEMEVKAKYKVLVRNVEQVRIQATLVSSGGLVPNSRAKIVCRWELQAIEV